VACPSGTGAAAALAHAPAPGPGGARRHRRPACLSRTARCSGDLPVREPPGAAATQSGAWRLCSIPCAGGRGP